MTKGSFEDKPMQAKTVSGITFTKNEYRIIIRGIINSAELISFILNALSDASIELDMLVHNVLYNGTTDLTFTVRSDFYG